MMKKSPLLVAMQYLTWLTQLGLSLATPIILCLLGAWWLREKFALGSWIFIPAIILGVGGAISSFASFAKYFLKKANNNDKSE